jgi:hypothetical protein
MSATPTFEEYYSDDDIKVTLQWESPEMVFLHLRVYHWSLGVKRKMVRVQEQLFKSLTLRGVKKLYAYNAGQDDLWRKFCRSFGFKYAFTYEGKDIFYTECSNGSG